MIMEKIEKQLNHPVIESKVLKETNLSIPRALNRLTAVQFKKPPRRKTSPLSWFPRKKGDSYLKRKLKLLQEVDGMNSTLDETLCNTNPHFSKVLEEKMVVREAAHKAIEARKAALVEASWLRILQVARIECKEAEDLLAKAEKTATEAFESAKEIGVIMYDIQDHPRKHFKLETSATNGGESTTHTVTTSFDTAFKVDKQVAAAVKAAFVKLSTCASIGKEEFKELLKKISQNPDLDENCQDICEYASECESDAGIDSEPKSHKNETEITKEKLVDMMLKRLRCLHEEELGSLATIVATCGLNAALSEAENGFQTNQKKQVNEELPGLDKFLVKRLTRLERDVLDAKNDDNGFEKSINDDNGFESLDKVLVKHVSRLEKEKMAFGGDMKVKRKDKNADLEHGEGSLDQIMIKHKSRLEREKVAAANVDGDMKEEMKVKERTKMQTGQKCMSCGSKQKNIQ